MSIELFYCDHFQNIRTAKYSQYYRRNRLPRCTLCDNNSTTRDDHFKRQITNKYHLWGLWFVMSILWLLKIIIIHWRYLDIVICFFFIQTHRLYCVKLEWSINLIQRIVWSIRINFPVYKTINVDNQWYSIFMFQ